jgi:glycosyltransferase involved in cell wall biosynthesis
MSTLILSPFFFPEPISTGKYNTVLAECLARRGERVAVFASHPLYPTWRPSRSDAALDDIAIRRGGAWVRYPRSAVLRRAVLETWYAFFACISYWRSATKPQRIVPILPPGLFVMLLRPLLARGTRVIGIVHDLQGVLAARSGSTKDSLLRACIRSIERRSLLSCDHLIFLSRSMAERAIREYGLRRDVCSVHYPFQSLAAKNAARAVDLENTLPADRINVVYSGALGDKQSPDELLEFMTEVAERNPSLRCHIFSAGPHFDRLSRVNAPQTASLVTFHGLVPEEQLAELYSRSDVQVIPQASGTGDGALPSKLPNLIAAGVPIFAICDSNSEVGRIIADAGAGVTARTFSGAATMERFDALLAAAAAESRAARIERLRPFVERNFSVDSLVDTILKCA